MIIHQLRCNISGVIKNSNKKKKMYGKQMIVSLVTYVASIKYT